MSRVGFDLHWRLVEHMKKIRARYFVLLLSLPFVVFALLGGVLDKALAKNPAERYQHLDDLLVDLRTLRAQPVSGSRKS